MRTVVFSQTRSTPLFALRLTNKTDQTVNFHAAGCILQSGIVARGSSVNLTPIADITQSIRFGEYAPGLTHVVILRVKEYTELILSVTVGP